MANIEDSHLTRLIVNSIKNPVTPNTDSPSVLYFPAKPSSSRRARIAGEYKDCLINPLNHSFGKRFELLGGARVKKKAITHNLPARFNRLRMVE